MKEVWLPITDYEGYYEASSLGRIRGLNRKVKTKDGRILLVKGVILKMSLGNNGYLQIVLNKDGHAHTKMVHRLIAKTFINNIMSLPEVNHKNGDKTNNQVNNLEWNTASENQKHAIITGLRNDRGSRSVNSKLKEEDILLIRNMVKTRSHTRKEIALLFKINIGYIQLISSKKRWAHI